MCIVFFQQFDIDPPPSAALSPAEQAIAQRYAFVLASNRDEYFTRPTRRAHVWDPSHEEEEGEVVLAGKDLLGGGTWLGVTRSGRVAVLTNYRTPGDDAATATAAAGSGDGNGKRGDDGTAKAPAAGKKRSRGHLVLEYLHGKKGEARVGPLAYAERVVAEVGFVRFGVLGWMWLVVPFKS